MTELRAWLARIDREWLKRWLPGLVTVLLLLLLAHALARLTWAVAPEPEREGPAGVGLQPGTTPGRAPGRDDAARAVAAWHLFGEARERAETTEIPREAPETTLQLTLNGVIASRERQAASAIVSGPDGKEKGYTVDEELPGGARLKEIYRDRVILWHKGRYETLRLRREKLGTKEFTVVDQPPKGNH